jgi:hypothetical protein
MTLLLLVKRRDGTKAPARGFCVQNQVGTSNTTSFVQMTSAPKTTSITNAEGVFITNSIFPERHVATYSISRMAFHQDSSHDNDSRLGGLHSSSSLSPARLHMPHQLPVPAVPPRKRVKNKLLSEEDVRGWDEEHILHALRLRAGVGYGFRLPPRQRRTRHRRVGWPGVVQMVAITLMT